MRPVSVNFSVRRKRPYDHAGWALLVVLVGVGLFLAWHYAVLAHEFDAGEAEYARSQRPASGFAHVSSAEEKVRLRTEMRFARRIIEQLDTPWPTLFAAVETAYDDNVTLLGVEPEPERREVRLLAEAKDAEAMLAYVRQVRQLPVLKDAWLVNHQVSLQDPLHPVRFTINARWLSPSMESSSPKIVVDDAREKVTTGADQVIPDDIREEATADAVQVIAGNVLEKLMRDAGHVVADGTREEVTTDVGREGASMP